MCSGADTLRPEFQELTVGGGREKSSMQVTQGRMWPQGETEEVAWGVKGGCNIILGNLGEASVGARFEVFLRSGERTHEGRASQGQKSTASILGRFGWNEGHKQRNEYSRLGRERLGAVIGA